MAAKTLINIKYVDPIFAQYLRHQNIESTLPSTKEMKNSQLVNRKPALQSLLTHAYPARGIDANLANMHTQVVIRACYGCIIHAPDTTHAAHTHTHDALH